MPENGSNGNGNGRNGLLRSISRIAEGIAVGVGCTVLVAVGAMQFSMRDDVSDIRRDLSVMQEEVEGLGRLHGQQVQENSRAIEDLRRRIERIETRLFR